MVPNPCILLAQIPEDTKWLTVSNLKDAFFCILLHPDSLFLSAFKVPSDQSPQLTWTVFPQGFRGSPHLFGQALTQDLCQFDHPQIKFIRYADDILLCAPSEEASQEGTKALFNFLQAQMESESVPLGVGGHFQPLGGSVPFQN